MALLLVGHDVARSQERSQVHVVRRGDSLSTIALRYRLSLAELQALNPALENPNAIQAG
jgi:LysM repeat protein